MNTKKGLLAFLLIVSISSLAQTKTSLAVKGLQSEVEVVRDRFGINHIYAQNEHDLFFTQGYCAAKDRLFQFELWRRQATGTTAEILGTRELKRDIGTRLFKFRGNLTQEFNHYHPRGAEIIPAFTEGINAYVAEALRNPLQLPLEFKLLGIQPGYWTPEVVISRHQGLLGNLSQELTLGRAVATLGADKVRSLDFFEPGVPELNIDPAIRQQGLFDNITELYDAFRKPVSFTPSDLIASANTDWQKFQSLAQADDESYRHIQEKEHHAIGSNNWIVSGALSQSGFPLLANDPHRALAAPSLRYMVHLNGPGWNVVGGGEPTIPGISIGHNDYGAWGLTVFAIDGEDIYMYELNPQNQNQYKYQGRWEDMRSIKDTIKVKGAPDVYVEHKYTRHGPVTMIDAKNNSAYAIRCAWMEPGGSPYLASLRIDQAKNWEEFREGCSYSHLPGENMIWIDQQGNIGWQAVGIAPIRKNWSGLVPVPGDGRYEWGGYLPITSLPHVFNPSRGYWATANENLVPPGYPHRNAVGWEWADTYRADRINEVLGSGKKHSLADMMRLQFDYLSIPARTLVPFLKEIKSNDPKTETARAMLLNWNFVLDKNSIEAAIYVAWEKRISENIALLFVPEKGRQYIRSIPLSKTIDWIVNARPEFGEDPVSSRDNFLLFALMQAVTDLSKKLGPDMKKWQYGQPGYHHVLIKHPLSNAVDDAIRKKLEAGPLPRGGYGSTPGMTTNADNQQAGASFRIAADASDWDKTMFTNTPGQSGNPDSPYYKNLFELWANDKHFPVYFSREMVEKSAAERTILNPK
ncbi:MAG: penicillin acylase family protein [Cyclobacteriaceae bacterium]|nr:penicillin acylase family protein [Cyclobacteriaceae bacterium]